MLLLLAAPDWEAGTFSFEFQARRHMCASGIFSVGARSRVTAGCSVGAGAHISAGLRVTAFPPPGGPVRLVVALLWVFFLCVLSSAHFIGVQVDSRKKMRGIFFAGLWCVTPIYNPGPIPDPPYRGDILGITFIYRTCTVVTGHLLTVAGT